MTEDIEPILSSRIQDLTAHRPSIFERLESPLLSRQFGQIAWIAPRRLPIRIPRTVPDARRTGRPFGWLAVPTAACSTEPSCPVGEAYEAIARHGALAATAMADSRRAP